MKFKWDEEKNRLNIKKHGIDFPTATKVFNDENRIEVYDNEHSIYEDRYITIGLMIGTTVVIVVTYTEREEAIRIISARTADRQEEKEYYDSY